MKKELKKYLEEMIEDEWNRYNNEILEETSEKVIDDDNIYVNYEDYTYLGGDIVFDNTFKFDNKLYGLCLNENEDEDSKEVYSVVEINPMILLDDDYKEDEYMDITLIDPYLIEYSGFDIEVKIGIKFFNKEKYMCYIKHILIKRNEEE